jgi:LytR cell envelope-related transcriptional attenuator
VLGALLLVLGLMLAFFAYSALGHPHGRQAGLLRPLTSAPAVAPGTAAAGQRPAGAQSSPGSHSQIAGAAGYAATPVPDSTAGTPVIVLDNTGRPSLARSASTLFERAGWSVTETSTFDGDILSTAAYYDPMTAGAQAAAEALQVQFPAIQRVRPKFDGLPQGPIVVVLTYDYSQGQTTS